MKTILKIACLTLFTLFMFQPAQGQRLLKRIQEKVEQKVEQKVEERAEKKADEVIDKQLDNLEKAVEGAPDEESGENTGAPDSDERQSQRMQNLLKGMGMSGDPVPVADSYRFDHRIEMHVESFDADGNKESEGEFITHLNPQSQSMAYEVISGDMGSPGQGMFIIDAENGATIILSDENGKKSGIVYGLGTFFESLGQTYEEEADLAGTQEAYLAHPNVKKTGRTKSIAGFKCDEYEYTDETSVSHVWITTDLKMNTRDFFSTLFKTSLYSRGIPWGYMMEVTSRDKNSGERSTMQVTKVEQDSNVNFSLSDYEMTNLGSFKMPAGENDY